MVKQISPNKAFKLTRNTLHLLWLSLRAILPQNSHRVTFSLTRR
jgi:hypothetical protein